MTDLVPDYSADDLMLCFLYSVVMLEITFDTVMVCVAI